MMREGGRLRAALVLLLLVSAALFAIGATVERHQHREAKPSTSETTAPTGGATSETGGEGQHAETHATPGVTTATSSEDLFGVNPEAPWVVALGVAASVLLVGGIWLLELTPHLPGAQQARQFAPSPRRPTSLVG